MLDLPESHQAGDIAKALTFVRGFALALDGGAHRGIITRQLLRKFGRVVAVEPGPLADLIPAGAEVVRAALGAAAGECSMRDGTENTGQRHVVEGSGVQVVTIDSLGLVPDFIKLDVEGMEYHALLGGEQTIRTHRPVVMIEENGLCARYGVKHGAAGGLLDSWGFARVAVCNKDWIYA